MQKIIAGLILLFFSICSYGQVFVSGDPDRTSDGINVKGILIQLNVKSSVFTEEKIKQLIVFFYKNSKDKRFKDLNIYFTSERLNSINDISDYIEENTPFESNSIIKYRFNASDMKFDEDKAIYFSFDIMDYVFYKTDDNKIIIKDLNVSSNKIIKMDDANYKKYENEFLCGFESMQHLEFSSLENTFCESRG